MSAARSSRALDRNAPPPSLDDTTRSFAADPSGENHQGGSWPVLTLLWSAQEPERVGEIAVIRAGSPLVLGRAGNLSWLRSRPGREERTGNLTDAHISREQLGITVDPDGAISIENIGREHMLRLNGLPVERCSWSPGALIELNRRFLFRCERRELLGSFSVLPRHPFGGPDAWGIVGESPAAWRLRSEIAALGPLECHVMIHGPSGSGKELVAAALHALSRRSRGPWVSRSATTIPESLVDAELFGNLGNYPNPGMTERPGLIGAADGGTLFLDEVGELQEAQQARLLRVLDSGEYTRLGEAHPRRANLRTIGATNRPLDVFKEDVLARFPMRIALPGLDTRRSDIPLVATHLVRRLVLDNPHFAKFTSGDHPRFAPRLIAALVEHPYTTHVRELRSLLMTAMTRTPGDRIDLWDGYEQEVREEAVSPRVAPKEVGADEILACFEQNPGMSLDVIARELGLSSRHVLRRRMEVLGISRPS